jgi:hypothetical protein
VPAFLRSGVLILVSLALLYVIGRGILRVFGIGGGEDRAAVTLTIENRGTVNASLEGGLMQRADTNLKLYAGDKISATGNAHARLTFFDGSWVRTDSNTDVSIDASSTNEESSAFGITISKGAAWISTPGTEVFSGSIIRTIKTNMMTLTVTGDTQAAVDGNSLMVFSAEGNGIGVTTPTVKTQVFIGEGQQLNLPDSPGEDLLKYRSAIDPVDALQVFVSESRTMAKAELSIGSGSGTVSTMDPNALLVSSPVDNAAINGTTVTVSGKFGANIDRIRINGHLATLDRTLETFTEELVLTDGPITEVHIEAIDANDIVLDQVTRTIKKISQSIDPPTITSPAGNGQTYRTQETQVEIKGKVPSTVAGIMVNDYKLQLFRLGDTTWSYLASKQLNNFVIGKNVFNVYALDAAGNPSAPATITVLVEAGTVGIVSTGSTIVNTATPTIIEENTLPKNAPLTPGILSITGPKAGTSFTATGSEILIEGATSAQTASVWINGYKLQLYKPGKTFWNYIAKTEFGTMKKGANVYRINARDKEDKILDSFEYTVTY